MSSLRMIAAASILALSASAAAQPAAVTIDVLNFAFTPQPIQLVAGKPVTLMLVNRSGSGHDFTAPAFFAAAQVTAGAAPKGEIDLRGHEAKSITLVPRAGTYEVHCSHFLHKQLGMVGTIIVR